MARLTGEASLVEQINVMAATICPQVIMLVTSRVITMMNMTMRMRRMKNIRDGVAPLTLLLPTKHQQC